MSQGSPVLRAVYIVLVPMVLLIIFLNSGFLQQHIPTGTSKDTSYTVCEYNYYFFTYFNDFIDENEDNLEKMGYDQTKSDAEQYVDDEKTQTWRDYFLQGAEELLEETNYYYDLAVEADYDFSDDELSRYSEKLAENQKNMTDTGIAENSWYVAYYGVGMNVNIYQDQLLKQVKAEAYKQHLIDTYQASEADIDAYVNEHDLGDYKSVNISVITMSALKNRSTDEIDENSLSNLQKKLDALNERYESGVAFSELQSAFSDCSLGDDNGTLNNAAAQDLPSVLSTWCVDGQTDGSVKVGDYIAVIDKDTGIAYLAVLNSFGNDAAERSANIALAKEKIEADETAAVTGDYVFNRNSIGMTLAAK